VDKKEDNMKRTGFPAKRSLALLIDPDKANNESLDAILDVASKNSTDYIFTGGSITFSEIDTVIAKIRARCNIPVILFPGSLLQLTRKADRILLLSLISGRNPELLIGNHVLAAPFLKDVRDKITSVGYILINCGGKTSVEYMSQTESIPSDKAEIVVATAIAGEMLGLGMIYLEGGSGADNPVPPEIIASVRENISIPIAVGGGIRTGNEVRQAYMAGADLVILGNGCEKKPELLSEASRIRDLLRKEKP
jgi:geranylgeranylglyceryl phosphate synthase family protein